MFDDSLVIDLIASQVGVAVYQARQWTQLQEANVQLAKLDEMKSNLIDTVSHELRTPLTNIKGYTSRLIRYDGTLDNQTKIQSLKVIKQQADRLSRLVEDLLTIPEMERQGGLRVYPDCVDLNELVSRAVGFMEEKGNRTIAIHQPDHAVAILADLDRMEQVVLNLLDNAIKYAAPDAHIAVSILPGQNNKTARLEVFNSGETIPADQLKTLFAKFKRLDERLTRTTRGTGLGLFITKGLIEAMGGHICLESENGFKVIMDLPLYDSPAETRNEPHEAIL